MTQGIYKIVSKATGKFYIGSSKDISKRFNQHVSELKRGKHHSKKLQDEYTVHGQYNFTLEIVETVSDLEKLQPREQYWIDKFEAFSVGLNSSPYADRPRPLTPDEIRQLSDNRLVLPYIYLPPLPKSNKEPVLVRRHGLMGRLADIMLGVKMEDQRSDYDKLCDKSEGRIAVMDGEKPVVEFYIFAYSERNIYSGGELLDGYLIPKYMMVDPVNHDLICTFDKGEEQIRRWLRQNSLKEIKNYKITAQKWLESDTRKQNVAYIYARTHGRGPRYFGS